MRKDLHTKATKASRRTWCDLRVLCVALLFFAGAVGAQETTQKSRIICDHAAPPQGMHYVCKSQCDCHLEGKLRNDEDGVVPPATDKPKVCSYDAPNPGRLLVCDSDCKCGKTYNQETALPPKECQQPVSIVPPVYPVIARTSRIQGNVSVYVTLASDGLVIAAHALRGQPMLAKAAEEAVKQWRFGPSCRSNQIVRIGFNLTKDAVNDPPGFAIDVVATIPEVNISSGLKKKK